MLRFLKIKLHVYNLLIILALINLIFKTLTLLLQSLYLLNLLRVF